jgi:adenylylsulfate kinase-like enzyme
MIILDPVQRSALRKSATEAIEVAGLRGTGKTTLANLIAVQSAENGQSCLLVGGKALASVVRSNERAPRDSVTSVIRTATRIVEIGKARASARLCAPFTH